MRPRAASRTEAQHSAPRPSSSKAVQGETQRRRRLLGNVPLRLWLWLRRIGFDGEPGVPCGVLILAPGRSVELRQLKKTNPALQADPDFSDRARARLPSVGLHRRDPCSPCVLVNAVLPA